MHGKCGFHADEMYEGFGHVNRSIGVSPRKWSASRAVVNAKTVFRARDKYVRDRGFRTSVAIPGCTQPVAKPSRSPEEADSNPSTDNACTENGGFHAGEMYDGCGHVN